tara:strand:- start:3 stop:554 length:552 start_codon:yes stop_codon:yes gene_type:complete
MGSVGYKSVGFPSAVAFLQEWAPGLGGCIVTDMRMPGMSGIELLERLRRDGSQVPVILISGHATVQTGVRAMKLGALDFLEKPLDEQALLDGVNSALTSNHRRNTTQREREALLQQMALLSSRESEVLRSVLGGASNRQIAGRMGVSPKTVETYRSRILEKTGFKRIDGLCEKLVKLGIEVED